MAWASLIVAIVSVVIAAIAVGRTISRDRKQTRAQHPGPGTQRQHLAEQASDRPGMRRSEAGNRGVVRVLIRCDHPERHVLDAPPLDLPARTFTD